MPGTFLRNRRRTDRSPGTRSAAQLFFIGRLRLDVSLPPRWHLFLAKNSYETVHRFLSVGDRNRERIESCRFPTRRLSGVVGPNLNAFRYVRHVGFLRCVKPGIFIACVLTGKGANKHHERAIWQSRFQQRVASISIISVHSIGTYGTRLRTLLGHCDSVRLLGLKLIEWSKGRAARCPAIRMITASSSLITLRCLSKTPNTKRVLHRRKLATFAVYGLFLLGRDRRFLPGRDLTRRSSACQIGGLLNFFA